MMTANKLSWSILEYTINEYEFETIPIIISIDYRKSAEFKIAFTSGTCFKYNQIIK